MTEAFQLHCLEKLQSINCRIELFLIEFETLRTSTDALNAKIVQDRRSPASFAETLGHARIDPACCDCTQLKEHETAINPAN